MIKLSWIQKIHIYYKYSFLLTCNSISMLTRGGISLWKNINDFTYSTHNGEKVIDCVLFLQNHHEFLIDPTYRGHSRRQIFPQNKRLWCLAILDSLSTHTSAQWACLSHTPGTSGLKSYSLGDALDIVRSRCHHWIRVDRDCSFQAYDSANVYRSLYVNLHLKSHPYS